MGLSCHSRSERCRHATALLPTARGLKPQPLPWAPEVQWGLALPTSPSTSLPFPSLADPSSPSSSHIPISCCPRNISAFVMPQGFCTCCSLCQECFSLGWLLVIPQSSAPQGAFPDHPFPCILQHHLPISSTASSPAWNKFVDLLASRWCPPPTRVGWSLTQPSTWHLQTANSYGYSLKVPGTVLSPSEASSRWA